jgi:hypothetical protein
LHAKEASRRLTQGRLHNNRQRLTVKHQTAVAASKSGCDIMSPLLDDKGVLGGTTEEQQ